MADWQEDLTKEEQDRLKKAPPPERSRPMLATLTHEPFSDKEWIFERKLDGERILAFRQGGEVRLLTRNGKDAGTTYPEIVEALEKEACKAFVADGEVVAFDGDVTSFSRLQQRMQIRNVSETRKSEVPVYYYLFDLMYLDGYELDDLPLRTRKKLLKRALVFHEPVRYTPHRNTSGKAYFKEACGKGWEGLIAKKAGAPYVHKRSRDWLKFKCTRGQEMVIGGYTAPEGSRTGFGALLLGYYEDGELRYAGRVGTGFSEDELRRLLERFRKLETSTSPFAEEVGDSDVTWLEPELVAEIGFTEWTDAGRLRHPRFLGLRRDKSPEEVVREPQ